MTEYVCGFMVTDDAVALIERARPAWRRGRRLNGIGGRIEPGESPEQAIAREFYEEAGHWSVPGDWEHRVTLTGNGWRVYFLRASLPGVVDLPTAGDDPCVWVDTLSFGGRPVGPHLRWLIPLCLDDAVRGPVEVFGGGAPETSGAPAGSRPRIPSPRRAGTGRV